ncbi:MAG: GerW family sporulation protein [Clostridia bacterium]|nr:GerW family sporulation protein [Clostridia bacterium]
MSEHPIEGLMVTAMNSIKDMIDVDTIIGEPIEAGIDTVIIPISKVTFGFAAGGSEFRGETVNEYTRKDKEELVQYRLPFGGGSGAGVSIEPVAFLTVNNGNIKLLPIDHDSCIDKLMDYIPDALEKIEDIIKTMKCKNKNLEKLRKKIECEMDKKESIKDDLEDVKDEVEDIKEDIEDLEDDIDD